MVDVGRRVLVVDDSELLLDVARLHLEAHGLTVATATGLVGLRREVEARPPDLIICDVTLPGSTNEELAATIRELDIPVWLFSGLERVGLAARAELLGASAFVSKSEGLDALAALIAEHFANFS
jgi:CheY-like chemotaxis protein